MAVAVESQGSLISIRYSLMAVAAAVDFGFPCNSVCNVIRSIFLNSQFVTKEGLRGKGMLRLIIQLKKLTVRYSFM